VLLQLELFVAWRAEKVVEARWVALERLHKVDHARFIRRTGIRIRLLGHLFLLDEQAIQNQQYNLRGQQNHRIAKLEARRPVNPIVVNLGRLEVCKQRRRRDIVPHLACATGGGEAGRISGERAACTGVSEMVCRQGSGRTPACSHHHPRGCRTSCCAGTPFRRPRSFKDFQE